MLLHIHGFNSSPASNTFHMLRGIFPEAQALAYACHGLFADNLAALHAQAVELYQEALDKLGLAGQTLLPLPPLVITGSSLGGFYASQLAALLHAEYPHTPCHCALFNPVVYPDTALRPFLGRNTLMHSGEEWEFTPAMLESYAHFPDTRTSTSTSARGEANSNASCHADSRAHSSTRSHGDKGTSGDASSDTPHDSIPDVTQHTDLGTGPFPLRRFVLLGRNDSLLNPEEARHYWQHCARIHHTDDEHSIATLDAVTVAALRDFDAGS